MMTEGNLKSEQPVEPLTRTSEDDWTAFHEAMRLHGGKGILNASIVREGDDIFEAFVQAARCGKVLPGEEAEIEILVSKEA
jgi:hypothetical protein